MITIKVGKTEYSFQFTQNDIMLINIFDYPALIEETMAHGTEKQVFLLFGDLLLMGYWNCHKRMTWRGLNRFKNSRAYRKIFKTLSEDSDLASDFVEKSLSWMEFKVDLSDWRKGISDECNA